MEIDGIKTVRDAQEHSLVPITRWLFECDLLWLIDERTRIGKNTSRKSMIVKRENTYALFVNDVTGRYGVYNENNDKDFMNED